MPARDPTEIKKLLVDAGYEVYRTIGTRIVLADRVRDNLIMDSGVAVVVEDELAVRIVLRAQSSDFPNESDDTLFEQARSLAESAVSRGFAEVESRVVPIEDPSDRTRTLDTWYEVELERALATEQEMLQELIHAMGLKKAATQ